ncbi:MAG: L-aspartate oxidase [Planctomycetota bacterium]|jgi:L-aspartate oxidase|nr:L-aspartate oxidase [Planctomycetota bacterium]
MHMDTRPGPSVARYLLGFDLRRRPCLEADVVVVGSGVAGFAAALAAAESGSEVLLLTKADLPESNSSYAQGGIAAVLEPARRSDDDDLDTHIEDTLKAGGGLCDDDAVRDILAAGAEAIGFLERHGAAFDRSEQGVSLTREGGHSSRRILHAFGDATGRELTRALGAAVLADQRITVVENAFALDLITDDNGAARGVVYNRRGEFYGALGGSTVLATGGCGQIYRETTNPQVATGDGLAMAYRAGASVADMEFMQFHPTTLYIAGAARLLITEAMRGEGAVLVNHAGERFMHRYHDSAELAPRDVVSQAIVREIERSGFPHVWLDATALGDTFLRERFPTIHKACSALNIDISKDWIPVHPSAHYHCGGVVTDTYGRSSISQLFACGEVGCTGLHGANRLASNSLLEAVVVGLRAGAAAAENGGFPGRVRSCAEYLREAPQHLDLTDLLRSLRATMWRDVGIQRNGKGISTALRSIRFWLDHQADGFFREVQGWRLQNMLTVGALVAQAASDRSASVGTHLREDSTGTTGTEHRAYVREES